MGWHYRKSFAPLPGVRITLSPSGISTSIGAGIVRVHAGPDGASATLAIPEAGLSVKQSLSGAQPVGQAQVPSSPALHTPLGPVVQEIRSQGSGTMTTAGLGEYKRLLERSRSELSEIGGELRRAVVAEQRDVRRHYRWKTGWLFRHLFKVKFASIAAAAEESSARRAELEEQKSLAQLHTEIDMPVAARQAYARLVDDFAVLARAAKLWDTVSARATNRVAERTTATSAVSRKPVTFDLASCPLIAYDGRVPRLGNANGGEIYLYPAFVLYFVSEHQFALLEYSELLMMCGKMRFIEDEGVPHDSRVVEQVWAKANKNGSPDLRFKDNRQIPVAEYGEIVLKSDTGLHEEYLISNAEQTVQFGQAVDGFRAMLASRA